MVPGLIEVATNADLHYIDEDDKTEELQLEQEQEEQTIRQVSPPVVKFVGAKKQEKRSATNSGSGKTVANSSATGSSKQSKHSKGGSIKSKPQNTR